MSMSNINDRLTAIETDTAELLTVLKELAQDMKELNTALAGKAHDDYER